MTYQINNVLTSADSYKLTHYKQIFPGTTRIYETFTPRSLKHLPAEIHELTDNHIIWFGARVTMQAIHEAFDREFFRVNFQQATTFFNSQVNNFTGGEYDLTYIKALHNLGYLPIRVKSLSEGSLIPIRIAGMTITNTHDDFAWVVGYLETVISNETWKSVTNATIAFAYRRLLERAAKETVGDTSLVPWQGHDFSSRGMSGSADATRQGMSHLTSFLGTDGFGSASAVTQSYGMQATDFIGGSIPASEHMTETLAIQVLAKRHNVSLAEAEYMQMKRLITEIYPTGMIARVCDSYDYWNVITNIVPRLKQEILSRGPDALGMSKVVIRPDSGDPVKIVCGVAIPVSTETDIERWFRRNTATDTGIFVKTTRNGDVFTSTYMTSCIIDGTITTDIIPQHLITAEMKGTVECLWETFGGTITNNGYRLLDSHIGMIYGDSITVKRAKEIVTRLSAKGFASTNCFLGIGSYTYQMSSRDTLGMALKAVYAVVNGEEINLVKDPKTDDGTKKSALGRVRVEYENDDYVMYDQQTTEQESSGLLKVIYENGKLFETEDFYTVRDRINQLI